MIKLSEVIPEDFSITYEELVEWHLGKYKTNPEIKSDIYKMDLKSIDEVTIIFENVQCVVGRFSITLKGAIGNDSMKIDFMIAKHIRENTKNRVAFRTEIFNRLTEKQVKSLHAKIIDEIVPASLEKLRQYNEFLRQKNLKGD